MNLLTFQCRIDTFRRQKPNQNKELLEFDSTLSSLITPSIPTECLTLIQLQCSICLPHLCLVPVPRPKRRVLGADGLQSMFLDSLQLSDFLNFSDEDEDEDDFDDHDDFDDDFLYGSDVDSGDDDMDRAAMERELFGYSGMIAAMNGLQVDANAVGAPGDATEPGQSVTPPEPSTEGDQSTAGPSTAAPNDQPDTLTRSGAGFTPANNVWLRRNRDGN